MSTVTLLAIICLTGYVSAGFPGNLEVPLTPNGPHWFGEITVGTPKDGAVQKLRVQFDTGSTNLWVVAKENTITSRGFKAYDASKSDTYSTSKSPLTEKLHDVDDIKGYVAEDKLQIGSGDNAIVLDKQEFGEATALSSFLNGKIFNNDDGLFGIDLQEETAGQPKSPTVRMGAKYGKVPTIGFFINKADPSKSKVLFDGSDKDLYKGELRSHAVEKKNGKYDGWNVKITKLSVGKAGETAEDFAVPGGSYAKIITRMPPHIIGPKAVVQQIFQKLFPPSSAFKISDKMPNGYAIPCKTEADRLNVIKDLPVVTVYIDDKPYPLEPETYIVRVPDGNCIASIHASDLDHFIFGMGFLHRYYTKFDAQEKKVHFGSLK